MSLSFLPPPLILPMTQNLAQRPPPPHSPLRLLLSKMTLESYLIYSFNTVILLLLAEQEDMGNISLGAPPLQGMMKCKHSAVGHLACFQVAGAAIRLDGDISSRGTASPWAPITLCLGSSGLGVQGREVEEGCYEASVRVRILSLGFCVTEHFPIKSQLLGSQSQSWPTM